MNTRRALGVAALGASLLCVGLAVLLNLPKITPYEFFYCSPAGGGGEQCYGIMNPIYFAVFIFSIAGVVLLFYGLFDRAFVLGPFFALGMIVAAVGLAGVVFGYIGFESCGAGAFGRVMSCMAYHPEFFEPFILFGGSLISINVYSWHSATSRANKRARARFFGGVSVFFGATLFLFGFAEVATFIGRNVADEIRWAFWIEVAAGLALVIAGICLFVLSSVGENHGLPWRKSPHMGSSST